MEKFKFFNELKFTRDDKTGYYLNSTIRKRMHRYVWEFYNGEIPKGMHIHHIDHDKSNNDIRNLQMIDASTHTRMHANMNVEKNYKKMVENLNNIRDKASEWHKSEQGRDWHKEHYSKSLAKVHEVIRELSCNYCGKKYKTKGLGTSKFCSNNCKSKNRRSLGLDNVERTCITCGIKFTTNKYSKTKRCRRSCC